MKELILLFILLPFISFAQDDFLDLTQSTEVGLLSKAYQDSIVIRIVSTSSALYEEILTNGYMLERLQYDPETLSSISEREILNSGRPIKMGSLMDVSVLKNTEYSDIGKEIEENLFSRSDVSEANKQEEIMRHQMLALTCNVLPCKEIEVAKFLGLRFVDDDVIPGASYYYVARMSNPDTGLEEVLTTSLDNELEPTPKPQIVSVEAGDETLTVRWDSETLSDNFFLYDIERATETGSYAQINDTPILPMADERLGSVLAFYTDSVQNDIIYKYRLIGLTYFGERSPASEPLEGIAYDVSGLSAPTFTALAANESQDKVFFEWSDIDTKSNIKGFSIQYSNELKGNYSNVHQGLLAPESRSYSYDKDIIEYANYYRICVIDDKDITTCGFPKRLIVQDQLPPEIPVGFNGSIDSTGIVSLQWEDNTDEDLWGYYVYATNDSLTEFLRVTDHPLKTSEFTDTLSVNTLTKSIHYRVAAVDLRTNVSQYSERLELFRPDIIPPSPALITVMDAREEGNALMWLPSPFVDVNKQILERRTKNSKWQILIEMNAFQNIYLDKNVDPGKIYSYRIKTEDTAGNSSYTDKAVSLKAWQRKNYEAPSDFSVSKSDDKVTLKWNFEKAVQSKIIIYKAQEKTKLTKYKTISYNGKSEWTDSIDPSEDYKYMIKIYTANGLYSQTSNIESTN